MSKLFKRKFLYILLIIFVTVSVNVILAKGATKRVPAVKIITVEKGDTLWSIVKNNCTDNIDIRKAIYDIKKLNYMESSNIMPGQKIKIPSALYR